MVFQRNPLADYGLRPNRVVFARLLPFAGGPLRPAPQARMGFARRWLAARRSPCAAASRLWSCAASEIRDRLLEPAAIVREVELLARDAALHRGLRHRDRHVHQNPRIERLRDDV